MKISKQRFGNQPDNTSLVVGIVFLLVALSVIPLIGIAYIYIYIRETLTVDSLFGIEGGLSVFILSLSMLLYMNFFGLIALRVSTKVTLRYKETLLLPIITSTKERVDMEYLNPKGGKGMQFYSATDEQLVVQYRGRTLYIIALTVGVVFSVIFLFDFIAHDDAMVGFGFALLITVAFFLAYFLFYPTKYVVFDRMTGMVSLPSFFIGRSKKVRFEDLFLEAKGQHWHSDKKILLGVTTKCSSSAGGYIPGLATFEWWSWYVQYMDKNRPLPNGTLLSAYRQKDYERRKAEGFPEPLYLSKVNIPEWEGVKK
jgi:hypothetical protein